MVGAVQEGIVTRQQTHLAFGAFDVGAERADEVRDLLAAWSAAIPRLVEGRRSQRAVEERRDSGEVQELQPARLTVTLGLGPGLFARDGEDRFGLKRLAPVALRPLPAFPGDRLDPARCGGDLCVQACADDAQVAFHALRTLARLADGAAALRWAQPGFIALGNVEGKGRTPRNLLGFREGARNLREPHELREHVWVARRDRTYMMGGTYLVTRRIRLALDAWDATAVADQERAIGRAKVLGARLDDARWMGEDAAPVPAGAHIMLAGVGEGGAGGARMLRRSYNYFDGVDSAGGELDAGLFFMCFVADPRRQFVPMQQRLAEADPLGPFATYTGSAAFAIPPAAPAGSFIAEELFSAALSARY